MTDHAVFVPTAEGPVGGVVSEPDDGAHAGLILLPGVGRPARSGTNSFWAKLARDLAARGLTVLRVDYSREGETLPIGEGVSGQACKSALDIGLFRQVLPWFRERLGGLDLYLAGSCSGSRGAIELAGRDFPDQVARTFLLVPHLRVLEGAECVFPSAGGWAELSDPFAVDPSIVDWMRAILDRGPSWVLVGEHDTTEVELMRRLIGPTEHELELETVPGAALHMLDQPAVQRQARDRLVARINAAASNLSRPASPNTDRSTGRV